MKRAATTQRAARIFISYAHADDLYRVELTKHLTTLQRQGYVDVWSDRAVKPGDTWSGEIDTALEQADIVVCLLSADFLASDYIHSVELKRALERHAAGQTRILPILVRAVHIDRESPLGKLQRLPSSGEALAERLDQDRVWADVVRDIRSLVLRDKRSPDEERFGPSRQRSFIDEVEKVCQLREAGKVIERCLGLAPFELYLEVETRKGRFVDYTLVAGLEAPPAEGQIDAFSALIEARYRGQRGAKAQLVYRGDCVPEAVDDYAHTLGIDLTAFDDYQSLIQWNDYLEKQRRHLALSREYDSKAYVTQLAKVRIGREDQVQADARQYALRLLREDEPRFLLILADFGTGKTFLLRELTRLLENDRRLVPIFVELRALDKAMTLDMMLATHFARLGTKQIDLDVLHYMLEEGRIVLLFDGFDELAIRVSYDRATEHFDTILQAAQGKAKVVVTSRRQHFLSDDQATELVMAQHVSRIQGSRRMLLQPFELAQIKAFLQQKLGDSEEAEARYELIDDIKDLLGLSRNPRMLSFIVEVDKDKLRAAREREGKVTAANLYELLIQRWLGFEVQRLRVPGAPPHLTGPQRWRAVLWFGQRLWLGVDGAYDILRLPPEALEDIRKRGPPETQDLDDEVTKAATGAGTLLVRDEMGRFSFMHRSLLEFVVAWEAAAEVGGGRADTPLLSARDMSPLMADFFIDLVTLERAVAWVDCILAESDGHAASKNALTVRERIQTRKPEVKLERVDLAGQDLQGRDFSGQDFRGANLAEANLANTTWRGAVLDGANLTGANLEGANLKKASLRYANLTSANLSYSRLLGADLLGTKVEGASFALAALVGAQVEQALVELASGQGAATRISGRAYLTTDPGASAATCVAFHPHGRLVAAGYENGVAVVWDLVTGQALRVLSGHRGAVTSVAFSPNGLHIATGSEDKTAHLSSVSSGPLACELRGHTGAVTSVAFSPDGLYVATGSEDKTVRIWSLSSGGVARTLQGHSRIVTSVAFSPNGLLLASASWDNSARIWNVSTGAVARTLRGHSRPVTGVAFSPDGLSVATASRDNTALIWDLSTGAPFQVLRGHESFVTSVAFSSSGRFIATASWDKTARVWDLSAGSSSHTLRGHSNTVTGVAFSPTGFSLATVSDDKTVCLWDPSTSSIARKLRGHSSTVTSVAFSPNGLFLASVSDDQTARLWDLAACSVARVLRGHSKTVTGVAFSPNGLSLATASDDRTVCLWNLSSGSIAHVMRGHTDTVTGVAFSPNGLSLATASYDRTVLLWDRSTGALARPLQGHTKAVTSVAFSPNGLSLASASYDKTVRLWDPSTGSLVRSLRGHSSTVTRVSFSPDGLTLATASNDKTVRLWDVSTGSLVRSVLGHGGAVNNIAFSPDGLTLATASNDKTVCIWDVPTGLLARCLHGHTAWVTDVAFSPNGLTVATASSDKTVRFWDPQTGAFLRGFLHTEGGWVVFYPDGRYRAVGDTQGAFWHNIGLVRFEPGELDEFLPEPLTLPAVEVEADLPRGEPGQPTA